MNLSRRSFRRFFFSIALLSAGGALIALPVQASDSEQKAMAPHSDAQMLQAFDWVLLEASGAEGEEQSNLQAAGAGRPQLSFLSNRTLVVEQGCTSISGEYQLGKNGGLTYTGSSIAGSFCSPGASWRTNRMTEALPQLQGFQVLPNSNKFRVRLLLHFKDGSQWTLAPTNKLLILD